MESLGNAQAAGYPVKEGEESNCEHSFSTTLDLDGQCEFMGADSVVILESGAATFLACFRRSEHRNKNFGNRRDSFCDDLSRRRAI